MDDSAETKNRFSKIMLGVAEDFGGTLSKAGLKVKFEALQKYSVEDVERAGAWLLKNREKTWPAVPRTKEFIDVIEHQGAPEISSKSRAEMQVDEVLYFLYAAGRNAKPIFDDPITAHLMRNRWPYNKWASDVKEDEIKWWKKDFVAAYLAYSEKTEAEIMALDYKGGSAEKLKSLADSSTKKI